MRLLTFIAACAFALSAHAATLAAKDTSTLAAALKAAQPGDTILLAANPAWGDGYIANFAFAAPGVTIASADPNAPAVFRSMYVASGSGLNFDGVNIAFTPDAATTDSTAFLRVTNSHDVSWRRSTIVGGPAVNGIPENATVDQQNADTTGMVIGRPPGYGVSLYASQNITFEYNDVSQAHRLIVLNTVADSLIGHNYLHDRRTTAIAGAGLNRVTFDGNVIAGAHPWNWATASGQPGYHDHADMLALYSLSGQTTPNDRVTITNNLMVQLADADILGMWVEGSPGAAFTNLTVSGNLILDPNLQGIMVGDIAGGVIANNTLVQVPLPSLGDNLPKWLPTIIIQKADVGMVTSGIAVTNNAIGVAISDTSGGVNPASGTTLTTPTKDLGATEIRAWLPAHPDMAALAANLLPAAPPVPAPPAVDPRDGQIADLAAKLAAASTQIATLNTNLAGANVAWSAATAHVATLTQQLSDAKAAQVVSLAQVADLQTQLAAAQASLSMAQQNASALSAKLATDEAKLAGLRAAVAP